MKLIFYYCIVCFISLSATCNKRIDCSQTIYTFEAFYKAYPDKDSIAVNDTIWLELTAPIQLKDVRTNQPVDYSGAVNFGPSIQYGEFTGGGNAYNPGGIAAANSFENILTSGLEIPSGKPEQVRGFRCVEDNGYYKFKLGIVPKKKGSFVIGLSNAAGVYRKNNECDKAAFTLTFKDTDQHLYLYEQSRPGYVLSISDQGHLYCFVVY